MWWAEREVFEWRVSRERTVWSGKWEGDVSGLFRAI